MSLSTTIDWVYGEDLAQLPEADREQVFSWLRECGVNPDRTRAIRLVESEEEQTGIIVAEEYAHWPITVGMRGIEMRTETYLIVGEIPEPLIARSN